MNTFSIKNSTNDFEYFNFVYKGQLLNDVPVAGMTLKKAGSMRFRWNEKNINRDEILTSISNEIKNKNKIQNKIEIVPVELIHSKIVYDVKSKNDILTKKGDGIITNTPNLMPVVTVADCMPIFLYDVEKKVYGIVHSGWKGTGIVVEAINLFCKKYGSKKDNICIILGPHINNCCYIVNQERADYFKQNFCTECVSKISEDEKKTINLNWNNGNGDLYRLSLLKANLYSLEKVGINDNNISICTDCTSCNKIYGSNRRETFESNSFTVQAAFITYLHS